VRVSSQGAVTSFAAGIQSPLGLAFDASGHLLVVSGDGAVYRVTPQGQAARFITDAGIPFWIAVAPDGRIWLTDLSDRSLRRYGPTGQFEARFDASAIGGSGPGPLVIGPSGEPFFSNGTEIWRLADGQPRRVFAAAFVIWAFAFDVAGNIYAPAPTVGRIELFDPAGTKVADPYAVGPDAPQVVAFGRDATGATVARLFATEPRVGRLIEVNPAGVAHPGLPVGPAPRAITPEVAAASLLGAGGLSEAERTPRRAATTMVALTSATEPTSGRWWPAGRHRGASPAKRRTGGPHERRALAVATVTALSVGAACSDVRPPKCAGRHRDPTADYAARRRRRHDVQ
jgi:sugar lactone lactonase YvrE